MRLSDVGRLVKKLPDQFSIIFATGSRELIKYLLIGLIWS
jgi:hypothetical protein